MGISAMRRPLLSSMLLRVTTSPPTTMLITIPSAYDAETYVCSRIIKLTWHYTINYIKIRWGKGVWRNGLLDDILLNWFHWRRSIIKEIWKTIMFCLVFLYFHPLIPSLKSNMLFCQIQFYSMEREPAAKQVAMRLIYVSYIRA